MRVFKTREFQDIVEDRKIIIEEKWLSDAIRLAEGGKFDRIIKGGIIIQRIKTKTRGKDSGYRTVILFKKEDRAIFVDVYKRSKKNRLNDDEIAGFKRLAADMLNMDEVALEKNIKNGEIIKVKYNG